MTHSLLKILNFKFGRLVNSHPHPTLFLKGYEREIAVTRKRNAPMDMLLVQPIISKRKKLDNDSKKKKKKRSI